MGYLWHREERSMNRVIRMLGLVAVMALGGVGWGHATIARAGTAPNSTCPTGEIFSGTYNNVTVLKGHSCLILAVSILGNLVGQPGNTDLEVDETHIFGNVQDDHGITLGLGTITDDGNTIDGNLQVTHMAGQVIQNGIDLPRVGGNAQFENNTGQVIVNFTTFGGNLQVNNNTGGVAILYSHIGNELSCQNNVPPPSFVGNTANSYSGQCLA
jgi:hypothetical protein